MRGFFAALDRFLDTTAPTRILEIGVGEGIVTEPGDRTLRRCPGDRPRPPRRRPGRAVAVDVTCRARSATHHTCRSPTTRSISSSRSRCSSISPTHRPPWPNWPGVLGFADRIGARSSRSGGSATWPRGRYLRDLGNTPGHMNHWTHRGFTKLVAEHFEVVDRATPLPWTMVLADVGTWLTSAARPER